MVHHVPLVRQREGDQLGHVSANGQCDVLPAFVPAEHVCEALPAHLVAVYGVRSECRMRVLIFQPSGVFTNSSS